MLTGEGQWPCDSGWDIRIVTWILALTHGQTPPPCESKAPLLAPHLFHGEKGRPNRDRDFLPLHTQSFSASYSLESVSTVIVGFDSGTIEEEINYHQTINRLLQAKQRTEAEPIFTRDMSGQPVFPPSFTSTLPFQSLTSSLDEVTAMLPESSVSKRATGA